MRIGIGHDARAFDPKRVLMLGGVKVPGAWGLRGPGDGDAVAGALIDALLGAAGLGDREDHFPAAETRWSEAPSAMLLAATLDRLAQAGLAPAHVDVTVVAERPFLRPHRAALGERLASLLRLPPAQVSVKATAAGGFGALGRAEGVVVLAVASLREISA